MSTEYYNPDIEGIKYDKIRELQEERAVKMVRYAYENVPLYKKKFKEKGITPDDIKGLGDFHKVPFTVKNDLRDHYPYGILAVPRERINRFHASSGTTGKPTVVGYTTKDLETWTNLMARCMHTVGMRDTDIMQNAYGYGLFTGGLGFHYGAEKLGATVIPSSTGNTKKQIMLINDMRTTAIACTPSYSMYLAEEAVNEGFEPTKDFDLKFGLFGAEPWSEEARVRIQDALGIKAMDFYGMSELYGPGVAVECPRQNGLHIWSDEFLVETIDPETGEVLDFGKKGEMVFTMLTREAMPLLRYRTRDLAIIDTEECECGRSHPRIMRIGGRSDDMLIIGGVNVFPSQIEHVLMNFNELGDQYLILVDRKKLDTLTIQVEVNEDTYRSPDYDPESITARIGRDVLAVLNIRAKIELVEPGAIPRSEGKAKRVRDMRTE